MSDLSKIGTGCALALASAASMAPALGAETFGAGAA